MLQKKIECNETRRRNSNRVGRRNRKNYGKRKERMKKKHGTG